MDASEIVVGGYYTVLGRRDRQRRVKVLGIREVRLPLRGDYKPRVMLWYDCQEIFNRQPVLIRTRKRFVNRLPDGNPAQAASVEV